MSETDSQEALSLSKMLGWLFSQWWLVVLVYLVVATALFGLDNAIMYGVFVVIGFYVFVWLALCATLAIVWLIMGVRASFMGAKDASQDISNPVLRLVVFILVFLFGVAFVIVSYFPYGEDWLGRH